MYAVIKNTWPDFEQLIEKDENLFDLVRNFLLEETLL